MNVFDKPFDTNRMFVGGNGLFLQYYDIVKPIYLYATISLLYGESYGLPIDIIREMSLAQLFEWYKRRSNINPLYSIDYLHQISENDLTNLLEYILKDESIYRVTPMLNVSVFFNLYHQQHMSFPVYIYSKENNPYIQRDVDRILPTIEHYYVSGDLNIATKKCRENFTYIFSDVELVNELVTVLDGTYSHILLAEDYRYNSLFGEPKYDLVKLMANHKPIRLGTTRAMDVEVIGSAFGNIYTGGER